MGCGQSKQSASTPQGPPAKGPPAKHDRLSKKLNSETANPSSLSAHPSSDKTGKQSPLGDPSTLPSDEEEEDDSDCDSDMDKQISLKPSISTSQTLQKLKSVTSNRQKLNSNNNNNDSRKSSQASRSSNESNGSVALNSGRDSSVRKSYEKIYGSNTRQDSSQSNDRHNLDNNHKNLKSKYIVNNKYNNPNNRDDINNTCKSMDDKYSDRNKDRDGQYNIKYSRESSIDRNNNNSKSIDNGNCNETKLKNDIKKEKEKDHSSRSRSSSPWKQNYPSSSSNHRSRSRSKRRSSSCRITPQPSSTVKSSIDKDSKQRYSSTQLPPSPTISQEKDTTIGDRRPVTTRDSNEAEQSYSSMESSDEDKRPKQRSHVPPAATTQLSSNHPDFEEGQPPSVGSSRKPAADLLSHVPHVDQKDDSSSLALTQSNKQPSSSKNTQITRDIDTNGSPGDMTMSSLPIKENGKSSIGRPPTCPRPKSPAPNIHASDSPQNEFTTSYDDNNNALHQDNNNTNYMKSRPNIHQYQSNSDDDDVLKLPPSSVPTIKTPSPSTNRSPLSKSQQYPPRQRSPSSERSFSDDENDTKFHSHRRYIDDGDETFLEHESRDRSTQDSYSYRRDSVQQDAYNDRRPLDDDKQRNSYRKYSESKDNKSSRIPSEKQKEDWEYYGLRNSDSDRQPQRKHIDTYRPPLQGRREGSPHTRDPSVGSRHSSSGQTSSKFQLDQFEGRHRSINSSTYVFGRRSIDMPGSILSPPNDRTRSRKDGESIEYSSMNQRTIDNLLPVARQRSELHTNDSPTNRIKYDTDQSSQRRPTLLPHRPPATQSPRQALPDDCEQGSPRSDSSSIRSSGLPQPPRPAQRLPERSRSTSDDYAAAHNHSSYVNRSTPISDRQSDSYENNGDQSLTDRLHYEGRRASYAIHTPGRSSENNFEMRAKPTVKKKRGEVRRKSRESDRRSSSLNESHSVRAMPSIEAMIPTSHEKLLNGSIKQSSSVRAMEKGSSTQSRSPPPPSGSVMAVSERRQTSFEELAEDYSRSSATPDLPLRRHPPTIKTEPFKQDASDDILFVASPASRLSAGSGSTGLLRRSSSLQAGVACPSIAHVTSSRRPSLDMADPRVVMNRNLLSTTPSKLAKAGSLLI